MRAAAGKNGTRTQGRLPGTAARILSYLLALLLTAMLVLTCTAFSADRLLTDRAMHEETALNDTVIDEAYAAVEAGLAKPAKKYGFDPETVLSVLTRDELKQYARDAVAWWTGVLRTDASLRAPEWGSDKLTAALEADTVLQEKVAETMRRTKIENDIAPAVSKTVADTVLPVRTAAVSFALSKVREKVDTGRVMNILPYAGPMLALLCGALAAAILLLTARRMASGLAFIGAALTAGGILTAAAVLGVYLLGIPGRISEINPLLGKQFAATLGRMGVYTGCFAAAYLIAGLFLASIHRRAAKRVSAGVKEARA